MKVPRPGRILLAAAWICAPALALAQSHTSSHNMIAVIPFGELGGPSSEPSIQDDRLHAYATAELQSALSSYRRLQMVEQRSITNNLQVIKDSYDPDHAVESRKKIGRILSADYLLIPTISYTVDRDIRESQTTNPSGQTVTQVDTVYRATLYVTADFVTVESGAKATRTNDQRSSAFHPATEPVDQQLRGCAQKAVQKIAMWTAGWFPLRGDILAVTGTSGAPRFALNIGALAGVQKGQRFDVMRPGETVTDPRSGRQLRLPSTRVGNVVIVEVSEETASAKLRQGHAAVGDEVVLEKD